MKKFLICIFTAASVALILPSCSNLLDTESPSSFDDATVYSNYTLAEQTIFAIHASFSEQNSYRGRLLPWYGYNTDIEWYVEAKPSDDKTNIVSYNTATNDSQLNNPKNPFSDMYSAIEKANLTIAGLKEYGDIENNNDMAYLYAEALTLRAMIYYDLVKTWGDVPARFEPLTSATIYVPKSSRDVIFKQILGDLDIAIPLLPYPNGSTATASTDRVNKLFAEGLYARIALAAAGYALRPADGKVGTGDAGSVRLSSDADLSKEVLYPKALAYLKDAIESNKASLYEYYEDLWRDFNNMDMTAGKEVLFSIPFGPSPNDLTQNVRGRWNYTFAIKCVKSNTILGKTITDKGGTAGPTPTFWFDFDPMDVRRDITCVNWRHEDNEIIPAGISRWYFGKYRFEWMETLPYNNGNDDGVKPIVMRYSDILLMAAEIENDLNGPAGAKEWFKQVRRRAFKGNEAVADEYVDALSSPTDFFNAIVDERAFEFCGEFLRKGDLIRWNLLSTKIEAEKQDLTALSQLSGDYAGLSGKIWWRENEAGDEVEIYGLGPGETTSPGADWFEEDKYIAEEDFTKDSKIECFAKQNPDLRQFWPIFDYIVTNSQGTIVNDYGY